MRIAEKLAVDVRAGIGISICDRFQLQLVEWVIHVRLNPKQRVVIAEIVCKLLGKAHVQILVARPAEAVAADSRDIGV